MSKSRWQVKLIQRTFYKFFKALAGKEVVVLCLLTITYISGIVFYINPLLSVIIAILCALIVFAMFMENVFKETV